MGTTFPEWLTREDIDNGDKPWLISYGSAARGEAWTDIDRKRMRVPDGDSDLARAIRAHEMMHAKVSPTSLILPEALANQGVTPDLVAAAEEVRVNFLSRQVGNDVDSLSDRTEGRAAKLLVDANDASGLVHLITATYGTKANGSVMRAIKAAATEQKKPNVYDFAKRVRKQIKSTVDWWDRNHRSTIASTEVCSEEYVDENDEYETVEMPDGYRYTLNLAESLANFCRSRVGAGTGPYKPEPGDQPLPDGERGQFADLVLDKLPLTERVAGRLGRKRIATNVGINPRRINRMLTDSERRIFDRRARGLGGVILIDQSGSMHLNNDDMWNIIKAAPGCTIIGYSHRPGSYDAPNTWVLAENGKVVRDIPDGNSGNGVDGPALLFARSKRKKGEPFIWVCDGAVTDGSADNCYPALTKWCADFVYRNGVHMVNDVDGAVSALKRAANGEKLPAVGVGALRRNT